METKLDKFGRPLPPPSGKYYIPSLTTDAVVVRPIQTNPSELEVLLVTRKFDPFKGCLALPGGFVDYNEDPKESCLRELLEETTLKGRLVELICVRGDPQRDPRKHVVTMAYAVEVDQDAKPKGEDDAEAAHFYPLKKVLEGKVAFDHLEIIKEHPLVKEKLQEGKKTRGLRLVISAIQMPFGSAAMI